MKYYLVPKYKKAIAVGKASQPTLTHFLTSQGDFDLPDFIDLYPIVCPTQLHTFFIEYDILPAFIPTTRRLTLSAIKPKVARSALDIMVDKLSLPRAGEVSYRVKKMLGKV